ncbi:hypothetical protein BX666DRAFT_352703 [Dichotomocladium elegans]|nr:hypothetical protein BX666DRAFT_352703 [Dichotomocladium elegans]
MGKNSRKGNNCIKYALSSLNSYCHTHNKRRRLHIQYIPLLAFSLSPLPLCMHIHYLIHTYTHTKKFPKRKKIAPPFPHPPSLVLRIAICYHHILLCFFFCHNVPPAR